MGLRARERLYAKARGQLASIEIPIAWTTSLRIVPGIPGGRGHDASSPGSVKDGVVLDDDAEREVQRTPCADERARQLQVGARVDEHPRVLVAEPEAPELLEAPAHHALILERELEGGWWVLSRRHTFYNDQQLA